MGPRFVATASLAIALLLLPGAAEATTVSKTFKHMIKKGETLTGILMRKYGFSPEEFRRLVPAILRLNPGIKDPNLIFYGVNLVIPLKEQLAALAGTPPAGASVSPGEELEPTLKLEQISNVNLREAAEEIFPKIGIKIVNSGETAFQLASPGQVRVDNKEYPLLELPGGQVMILDYGGSFPGNLKRLLESSGPDRRIVRIDQKLGLRGLLERVLAESQYFSVSRDQTVSFGNEARLVIRGDWKIEATRESLSRGKVVVLNVLEEDQLAAPNELKEYVRDYGFELVEVKRTGGPARAPGTIRPRGDALVVSVNYPDNPSLIDRLLQVMNLKYEDRKVVKLKGEQFTGIAVEFVADRFVERDGRYFVVDFSGLPGDLASFAREYGVTIISVDPQEGFKETVTKVLRALNVPHQYSNHKVLGDLERNRTYYDVEIPGFLMGRLPPLSGGVVKGDGSSPDSFLLTNVELGPTIEKILEARGFTIMRPTP